MKIDSDNNGYFARFDTAREVSEVERKVRDYDRVHSALSFLLNQAVLSDLPKTNAAILNAKMVLEGRLVA